MGPFTPSGKKCYILVAVDYVSKWVEAEAFATCDARSVIKFLKKLFARFGIPKYIISDRGTHFVTQLWRKLWQDMESHINYLQPIILKPMDKQKTLIGQ